MLRPIRLARRAAPPTEIKSSRGFNPIQSKTAAKTKGRKCRISAAAAREGYPFEHFIDNNYDPKMWAGARPATHVLIAPHRLEAPRRRSQRCLNQSDSLSSSSSFNIHCSVNCERICLTFDCSAEIELCVCALRRKAGQTMHQSIDKIPSEI